MANIPVECFLGQRVHICFTITDYLEVDLDFSDEQLDRAADELMKEPGEDLDRDLDKVSADTKDIVLTGCAVHALFSHEFNGAAYPPALKRTPLGKRVLGLQRAQQDALADTYADAVEAAVEALNKERVKALERPTDFGIADYMDGDPPYSGFHSDDLDFGVDPWAHWKYLQTVYAGLAARMMPRGSVEYEMVRAAAELYADKMRAQGGPRS